MFVSMSQICDQRLAGVRRAASPVSTVAFKKDPDGGLSFDHQGVVEGLPYG
jgi:hypothetical protein